MTKRQILNGWQKITNTQKTEDWEAQTTKNPDWHQLRCTIWICSSNFINTTSWAIELGAIVLPTFKHWGEFCPLFGIKFKEKNFSMEAYIVHLDKGMLWNHSDFFFYCCTVLKIYQTNKEYIFCTFIIKMYTKCNEHHLN